jgi:hypothetical protein
MAKYRCPQCGAVHKEPLEICRLCGSSMGEIGHQQIIVKKPAQFRGKTKGVGIGVLVGILLVVAIGLGAIAFGWVGGGESIQEVVRQVPGITDSAADGWDRVTDESGGWAFDLPSAEPTAITIPGAGTTTGLTGWSADISDETTVSALWGMLPSDQSATPRQSLAALADEYAAATPGRLSKTSDTQVAGMPAVALTIEDRDIDGQYAAGDAILILRSDRVYVLDVTSVNKDAPQMDRLRSSVAFS